MDSKNIDKSDIVGAYELGRLRAAVALNARLLEATYMEEEGEFKKINFEEVDSIIQVYINKIIK